MPLFLLDSEAEIGIVTYVDADLLFFENPEAVFAEMADASVLIIGHQFPDNGRGRELYGVYNVGWVSWRADAKGRACLEGFRQASLNWCCDVAEAGRFADQKYLDDWPQRFPGVHVLQHKGCNLAPWNLERYAYSVRDGRLHIDEDPLIFYHYHGFREILDLLLSDLGLEEYVTSPEGPVALLSKIVYHPYVVAARKVSADLEALPVRTDASASPRRGGLAGLDITPRRWRDGYDWGLLGTEGSDRPPKVAPPSKGRGRTLRALTRRRLESARIASPDAMRLAMVELACRDPALGGLERVDVLDFGGAADGLAAVPLVRGILGAKLGRFTSIRADVGFPEIRRA